MGSKNILYKSISDFVVILTLLLYAITFAPKTIGAELSNILADKDQTSSPSGYKISFLTTMQYHPLHDPNQGMVFMDCQVTWTNEGAFVMKINNSYEHHPVFVKPSGYAPDYDENGNFMIVRPLEELVLSTTNRNESIQKVRRFVIDPNGQTVRTDDNIMLYRWPTDKPYSTHQFNHFKIAMGRGFSRHLSAVKSTEPLNAGLLKINSKGSNGPGFTGNWELILDPNSDYLVRKASFTPDGVDKPIAEVTTSGVIEKDGIKLAKYGVLKYSNFPEYSIEVKEISKVAVPNTLYEEVFSLMSNPMPTGTSIVDMRSGKSTITTVE